MSSLEYFAFLARRRLESDLEPTAMHRSVSSPKSDRGRFLVSRNCRTFVASITAL